MENKYIHISESKVVTEYNAFMGVVDLADWVIGKYFPWSRTKKKENRFYLSFFWFCCCCFLVGILWRNLFNRSWKMGYQGMNLQFSTAQVLLYNGEGKDNVTSMDEIVVQEKVKMSFVKMQNVKFCEVYCL